MKKTFLGFSLTTAVVASLISLGCSDDVESKTSTTDSSAIVQRTQFVIGLDDAFPPLGFRDENNEIVGYDVDLAREVAKRRGWKFVAQPIDWNAKEMELNTHKIDCIWNGFTKTPEREAQMTFSPAYLRNAQVIVVRGDSQLKTLADFAGKTVATQAGSSSLSAIEKAESFKNSLGELVELKDNLSALQELKLGSVDGVVMDLLVANDNINRSGNDFIILKEALSPEEFGIGFRKGDVELMEAVWETLQEMAADGTIAKISEKYFGADISIIGK